MGPDRGVDHNRIVTYNDVIAYVAINDFHVVAYLYVSSDYAVLSITLSWPTMLLSITIEFFTREPFESIT